MARLKEEYADEVLQPVEITDHQQTEEQVTQDQRLLQQHEHEHDENAGSRTKTTMRRNRMDMSDSYFDVQYPCIVDRAKEVEANLNPAFPSFTKLMLHSHLKRRLLGLPSQFCKQHMPKHDETVLLVGDNGEGHSIKFLAYRCAFSGGWVGFCLAHHLHEGDIVIFQLVRPCEFKVYIVRRNCLDLDGASFLSDWEEVDGGRLKEQHTTHKKAKGNITPQLVRDYAPTDTTTSFLVANSQFESCALELHLESMDFSISTGFIDFQSFTIIVNGIAIDSELKESIRAKYYELCCSQKSYLHSRLLKTINPRLATEIILETVNLADALRACGVFTCQAEFAVWESTLEGFELLGMEVGFLRARLNQLMNLAAASTETPEFNKYNEARDQQTHMEEDIVKLETKLAGLKHAKDMLISEIEKLKTNVQKYDLIFQEAARAPW